MFEALRLPKTTTDGFRRYNLCSSETYSHLSMWCFLKCKFSWTFIPSLVRSGTQALCQLYHLYQLFSSMCVSIHLVCVSIASIHPLQSLHSSVAVVSLFGKARGQGGCPRQILKLSILTEGCGCDIPSATPPCPKTCSSSRNFHIDRYFGSLFALQILMGKKPMDVSQLMAFGPAITT